MRRATLKISAATALVGSALCGPLRAQPDPGPYDTGFQVVVGALFPAGGGEIWGANETTFTLDRSDFDGFALGFGLAQALNNRFEIGAHVDFYDETVLSSQRGFVDQKGFAIFHDTELSQIPLVVDLRVLPAGRYRLRAGGRKVLQPVPYLGGGLGVIFWEYEEVGDFVFRVDSLTICGQLDCVLFDRFKETGTAFEFHGLAGVEFPLGPRTSVILEGRYSVADAELDPEDAYNGPGTLELGGTSAYVGFSCRF
jgi:hypothetical protein